MACPLADPPRSNACPEQRRRAPTLPHAPRISGYTRPEIVFFLACVLLSLSLVIPAVVSFRQRGRAAMAHADIRIIVDAGNRFFREYGVWPTARGADRGDVRYGREIPNREVMHALMAVDADGNAGHAVNPQRIDFLIAPALQGGHSGLDATGEYIDPWGTPYQIVLDTDFNNVCDMKNSVYGRIEGEGLAAWSCGPDRMSDTPDDILSWKMRAPANAGE